MNFGFFVLTLLFTLLAVVNTFPADPFNKFIQCPKDNLGPIYPIEVTMSPSIPADGENVFTISGNFSLEGVAFNMIFKNPKSNHINEFSFACEEVKGCTPTNHSFKLPINFYLHAPDILSGPYVLAVYIIQFSPLQILGCVYANM
ncbi:19301_t:CDS:1, partial [Gigaspora margarita]